MDIDKIITRYLANESSQEEEKILKAWLKRDEANRESFELLKAYWTEESNNDVQKTKSEVWEKLRAVTVDDVTTPFQVHQPKKNFIPITVYKIAAAVLLLVVSYIGFVQYNSLDFSNGDEPVSVETIVKHNPSGKKSTIKLPDGTLIKLNSESQISFPTQFVGKQREITLSGEAFLEVTHDPNRPFVVKTGGVETRVLGTSFNIRAYPNQSIQKVALLEGKVEVYDSERNMQILLLPGEMVSTEKGEMTKTGFDYNTEFGWKDGILVFDNVSNEELILQLEKWFGYHIVLEKPLTANNYTSTFRKESLEEVLTIIGETKGFSFKILKDEEKVIIQ